MNTTQEQNYTQAQLKRGDPQAFLHLYREFVHPLYRFCYWQTGNATDAQDLTQDVFVDALHSIHAFRGDGSIKNWLYTIAKRKVLAWVRQKYQLPTQSLPDWLPDTDHWLDDENTQLKEQTVQRIISTLPPREKRVLTLRYMRSYSVLETAEALKTTAANVKVLCHRAIQRLRKYHEHV